MLVIVLLYAFLNKTRRVTELEKNVASMYETNQKRIRAAEEEKNRILAILESMSEGVFVVDPSEKITLANSRLSSILGTKTKISGHHSWEIIRDPDINAMIKKALREKKPIEAERTLLLSKSIFEIRISPIFSGNDFLGSVIVLYDVTKLKKLEKVRSEFMDNVSHELKTPLTSILGFIETLTEGAIEDETNRKHFLKIIEEHSKKLHRLIEDLLRISKMESGAETLALETFDVEPLMKRVLVGFDRRLQAKNLSVHLEIPHPFKLRADAKLLEDAVSNLMDNAIKYNKEGGMIRVRGMSGNGRSILEISDTGTGIAERDLPRIFERFFRAEKSRSRETGGSGLGLSIVKHVAELHLGSVRASSGPDGSVFTLELPSE